ncbi:MAG: cytochrome c biogenesis protein CcsA [Lentimicrobium sp.]|nr:cytochrome c biogenesis protein CcsA [Lentimicrobium sp.]HPG33807.1 cytochrome c biogenesis protein CcsA [Lentimicrobium sp.]
MIKGMWWKITGIVLILYSIIAGLLIDVPDLPVIRETIRNLFYHVCMWFAMFTMFGTSLVYSIKYLSGFQLKDDLKASETVYTGIFFGILGLVTGMIWAKFTWGDFWTNDPQLNGAAVSMMAYMAYVVLRSSIDEQSKRARISAVYNIFAFMLLVIFLGVLPRLADSSLHPGKGGNSSTMEGLDMKMRMVFYPAVAGWIIVAYWLTQLRLRKRMLMNNV